jgi:hypothetical protein
MTEEEHANALPKGFRLYEYQIQSVLGSGGFGITYLAWDTNLEKDVAIKEYLPVEFAVRQGETSVRPRSKGDEDDYYWGLERFLKEAQTLAVFRHPSIVPVFRFFEAHGTAYMVMEYEKGDSFASVMGEKRGKFTEDELRALLLPLFDGLAEVHGAGYLHRDIKPGNIFIRRNGTPVLLDFGAARHAVGRKSQNLTSIVTPGYAPLEQYFADGNQGPWTDIYALASILYQAVTGVLPPEAPARVRNDPLTPAAQAVKRGFSKQFLQAIDAGLAVAEEDRPQSIAEWRAMFTGEAAPRTVPGKGASAPAGATVRVGGASSDVARKTGADDGQKKGGGLKWAIAAAIALLLIGGGVVAVVKPWDDSKRVAEEEAKRQAAADEEAKRKAAVEDEARRKAAADAEAKRKAAADEEARRKAAADDEARRKAAADDEARRKAATDDEARRRAAAAEEERRRRETQTANVPRVTCVGSLPALNVHYDPTDCGYVQEFYNISMTSTPPGVTNRWRNSRSGNSGTVTVGRTYSANGRFCRKLDQTVVVRGQTHSATGTVCQSPGESSWHIGGG